MGIDTAIMLELDQYLNWCDAMYSNTPHCQCGKNCTNLNYCQGLQTNCYACVHRVHQYWNKTIHYNCDKMVLYYVLKHGYRFGAEVFYQLQRIQKVLSKYEDIYFVSIGCGPCTELFGALRFWRSIGKKDDTFHYRGFDTEPLWNQIMLQVCSYFNAAHVNTVNSDAFPILTADRERVDVIVLNYMLSDMKKFRAAEYQAFLSNLILLIQLKRPRFVLMNDIYLKVSLEASSELLDSLSAAGLQFRSYACQYHSLNTFIGQYGEIIPKPRFVMTDAGIVNNYDPFNEVNSIQTIIRFQ